MMTCIYDAWVYALRVGHDKVRLQTEPIVQATLFDEYVHVDVDAEKTEKVLRSVRNKIGMQAYIDVYYACLMEDDVLDDIYRFLRIGFQAGPRVIGMLAEPPVSRMLEIRRAVGNEIHHFREFARFNSIDNKVYVCHLEPKHDVIYQVAEHFADRMPDEYFMILDDNRKYAVIHPGKHYSGQQEKQTDKEREISEQNRYMKEKAQKMYLRELSDEEMKTLRQTELLKDEYTELWKTFFHTIGIEQRKNPTCQRNLMPIWKRKHAVEFMQ